MIEITKSQDAKIIKIDEDQRMVYGWASVIKTGGTDVIDSQDDMIEADELIKATTEFMMDARMAKAMHSGEGIGEVVHSFPLVSDITKGMGISSEMEGWIVGVKVHDDKIWKKVKSGEFSAFSIGGMGEREEVTQ